MTTTVALRRTSADDQFTYRVAPTVTASSPASGPITGGTSVTITGTGFIRGRRRASFGSTAGDQRQLFVWPPAHGHRTGRSRRARSTSRSPRSAAPRPPVLPTTSPTWPPRRSPRSARLSGPTPAALRSPSPAPASPAPPRSTSGRRGATLHGHLGHLDHRHRSGRECGHRRRHRDHPGWHARDHRRRRVHLRGGSDGHRGSAPSRAGSGRHLGHHHRDRFLPGRPRSTSARPPATSFTSSRPPDHRHRSGGGAGTVDVTVTTTGGTSATSAADDFTYEAAPTITGVSPSPGRSPVAPRSPSPGPI